MEGYQGRAMSAQQADAPAPGTISRAIEDVLAETTEIVNLVDRLENTVQLMPGPEAAEKEGPPPGATELANRLIVAHRNLQRVKHRLARLGAAL